MAIALFMSIYFINLPTGWMSRAQDSATADGQRIVLCAAIKTQRSDLRGLVLLNPAELHLLFCPSAGCAVLPGVARGPEVRLTDTHDKAGNSDDEETKHEELHRCTSLLAKLYFPTVLFFFRPSGHNSLNAMSQVDKAQEDLSS